MREITNAQGAKYVCDFFRDIIVFFSPECLKSSKRMADVPHTPERENTTSRTLPVRLPPVPHRADQLIEKVVDRQLAARQWVSSLTLTESIGRLSKLQNDLTDSALVDPHLQEFWFRRFHHAPAQHHKVSVSPSRKSNNSSSTPTPQRRDGSKSASECPIPLNSSPFQEDELVCLKTLLTVPSEVEVSLEHIDVFWLRDVILQRRTMEEALPTASKTLMNFDVDILSNSSEHHSTDVVPFHSRLINSPRSAVVLLRNGVKIYDLLRRPPEYFVKPTENVSRHVVNLRHTAAERERVAVLSELRRQYEEIVNQFSTDDVIRIVMTTAASRSDEAQSAARERMENDRSRFLRLEERDKRIAELRRQAALEAALSARTKALRSKARKAAVVQALKDKGRELHCKLEESRRVAEKINVVRELLVAEAEQEMSKKREMKSQRIAEMRQQKLSCVVERSAETEQKIARARDILAEQELAHVEQTRLVLEEKKRRAEQFLERKAQEQAALLHRSDEKNKNQLAVLERSKQAAEALRERIEDKMKHAERRFDELQEERREDLRCAKILHEEKEQKIQLTLEATVRAHEEMVEDIRHRAERSDQLLAQRLAQAELERIDTVEANSFSLAQKNRIVSAKQQQVQFARLLSLTKLTKQEEGRRGVEAMEEELQRLSQANKKVMTLRRHQSKANFQRKNVEEEKATFLQTMQLENEH